MVSGGAGSDTISYEGEAMSVTVDLSMPLEAMDEDDDGTVTTIAHVLATVDGVVTT